MDNNVSPQSLLPWLKSENNVVLADLFIQPAEVNLKNKSQVVPQVVSNSNPFARLLRAQMKANTGSHVKDIFLLKQNDVYSYSANIFETVHNSAIDRNWQKNYSLLKNTPQQSGFIDLACPEPNSDTLVPFRALFYCQLMDEYFHPPCPKCGGLLAVCSSDDCLSDAGLQAYSTSLKRYLHCPKCNEQEFYTYQRDETDTDFVYDRFDLLRKFHELLDENKSEALLPCANCAAREECFGQKNLVTSRVSPLSFYDFYMFAFDAATLNSFDFIGLVAGASVSELKGTIDINFEPGRFRALDDIEKLGAEKNNFLFADTDKWFLEILFLKLNYLQQLSLSVLSADALRNYSDLELSPEQFWIAFPASKSHLPSFWDFTVSPLGGDIVAKTESDIFKPASLRFYSFVLIWFFTLLRNQQQSADSIRSFLSVATKESLDEQISVAFNPELLAPENIFWAPPEQKVHCQWQPFWNRSLQLGWGLLKTSQALPLGWQSDGFMGELESLMAEVKQDLFQSQLPEVSVSGVTAPDEGSLIGELLLGIKASWRAREKLRDKTPVGQTDEQNEPPAAAEIPPLSGQENDDDLDKTVLLQTAVEVAEDADKTVILSTNNNSEMSPANQSVPLAKEEEDQDHLDETVILNPEQLASRLKKKGND